MSEPLVRAEGLRREYPVKAETMFGRTRKVVAVDDVSFSIPAGSTLGIVGESGSGKSTLAKLLLKLERPDGGRLTVDGDEIFSQTRAEEKAYRGFTQAVLQDPYGALSPRMSVGGIVGEPLRAQGTPSAQVEAEVARWLREVGLDAEAAPRYPHQFSGGQRQRIAIARALSVQPRLLVLDEPVSALDVSIRAQILVLLKRLQQEFGLTCFFIGHDLAIVQFISHAIGVMYFGRMVETGPSRSILRQPRHPYTRRLVALARHEGTLAQRRQSVELPNPLDPPSGCHFRARCPIASDICRSQVPPLRDLGDGHRVACHNHEHYA